MKRRWPSSTKRIAWRAAQLCRRAQVPKQPLKLRNDCWTVQLVLGVSLDPVAANEARLFQEREVSGDDRPVLHQVLSDILDFGSSLLQQDQDDLLPNRLGDRLEEVRVQRVSKRGNRQAFGLCCRFARFLRLGRRPSDIRRRLVCQHGADATRAWQNVPDIG